MIFINMSTVTKDVEIDSTENYIITGTSYLYGLIVTSENVVVYLDDININLGDIAKASINIKENANVTFIIKGKSNLYSGCNYAGLQMNGYCSVRILAIDNEAIINIYSGTSGAGIGGGFSDDFIGNLIIESGNINIFSSREGAGIGGGNGANGGGNFLGDLYIEGGNLNINGGIGGGAGIGGGDRGDLIGNVNINGGIINSNKAEGGIGAGIGGGCDGNLSGNVVINNGEISAIGGVGSAGIGGGLNIQRGGVLSGNISINGGKTVAYGGIYISTNEGGAGIGGGYSGNFSGDINLVGGDIVAKGGGSANDLGSGSGGEEHGKVNIKIYDIEVTPTYVQLDIGKSKIIKTTVIFDPNITANIDQFTKVEYISKDTNIAIVSQEGIITSVGSGKTNIIATCMADKSKIAICEVETSNKPIVLGEIDMIISVDKREIREEELENVICYGNNPMIIESSIAENIKSYKCNIDINQCYKEIETNVKYKEEKLYLSIIYSIALLKSDNCMQNLKIYALESSIISSQLKFCLGMNEKFDLDSFDIIINPKYTLDKIYSVKYYIFNITGTVEIVFNKKSSDTK